VAFRVETSPTEWLVYRRYSDFTALRGKKITKNKIYFRGIKKNLPWLFTTKHTWKKGR